MILNEERKVVSKREHCLFTPLRLPVAQMVKNLPAMWETWVRSLGWEDPLIREWLSSPVLWPREFHESMGSQRIRHAWVTFTSLHLPCRPPQRKARNLSSALPFSLPMVVNLETISSTWKKKFSNLVEDNFLGKNGHSILLSVFWTFLQNPMPKFSHRKLPKITWMNYKKCDFLITRHAYKHICK